jgi:hypothetical protein
MVQPNLIGGFTKDQWDVINVLGTWMSAFGSIAAAIVALYLANRSGAQRAKATVTTIIVFTPRSELFANHKEVEHFLRFEIVNRGDRPVRIVSLGWRAGFFRKSQCVQMIPEVAGNSSLPVNLEHGESARWLIPLKDSPESWEHYFADKFLRDVGIGKFVTLRATFQTSLGNVFTVRPGPTAIDRIKKAFLSLTLPASSD